MKRKLSRLLALTVSVEKIMVRMSWPWDVPKPVRSTTARQPWSGAAKRGSAPPCSREGQKIGHTGERILDINTGRLEDLGSTEEDAVAVYAINVEEVLLGAKLDALLEERGRFSGEHGLVDDTRSTKEKEVTGNTRVFLRADWLERKVSFVLRGGRPAAETNRWRRDLRGGARQSESRSKCSRGG